MAASILVFTLQEDVIVLLIKFSLRLKVARNQTTTREKQDEPDALSDETRHYPIFGDFADSLRVDRDHAWPFGRTSRPEQAGAGQNNAG